MLLTTGRRMRVVLGFFRLLGDKHLMIQFAELWSQDFWFYTVSCYLYYFFQKWPSQLWCSEVGLDRWELNGCVRLSGFGIFHNTTGLVYVMHVCSGHLTESGQAVLVTPCVNVPWGSIECLCLQLDVQLHVSNLKKMRSLCYISAEFPFRFKYINFCNTCKLQISQHFINQNETSLLAQMRGGCSHFTV